MGIIMPGSPLPWGLDQGGQILDRVEDKLRFTN